MNDSVLTVVCIVAFYVVVFGGLEVLRRWEQISRRRHPTASPPLPLTADEAMWETELNQPPTKEQHADD